MNENYPVFLSKIATGEDQFEGGSQTNLAEVISKVIKEDKLEKKVLGLEGEWGAGKTNLIKIIQNKLGGDYHTFIFDAWGSQEDLTRKSFLEQLINELFEIGYLTDSDRWKDLKNRLLSTTSTTHTQKFPLIKRHVLILSLSLLLLTILLGTYEYIGQHFDFINNVYFGFWKPILWIYLLPFIIFQWGARIARSEYREERRRNAEEDLINQETQWETIGKLFYWFNGNDINSEEIQNIIEDDPSVKQFREYFRKIEEDIKENGKLILVFDNLDRLEEDKLKSLWSSIHTFFAEDNKSFESWVIIPYDREKLSTHLNSGYHGFIGKTFSLNFRVTPPVVRQWEQFLISKFNDAFSKKLITAEEREFVVKLFDILTPTPIITPRWVVNYINNLVASYKIWQQEIESENLKFRYIVLFVLTKEDIVQSPHESILDRKYLGSADTFFRDDADLDTSISMITFGVKKELADEVLLDRQLKTALRTGNLEIINASLKHVAFQKYFLRANMAVQLNEKYKSLAKILDTVKDEFSQTMMKTFWEEFGKGILLIDSQFEVFNENHKAILLNTKKSTGIKLLTQFIDGLIIKLDSNELQEKYFNQIKLIDEFLKLKKIKINVFQLVSEVNFASETYLKFLKESKEEYSKYEINCPEDELVNFFFSENGDLNVDEVSDNLDELNILKEDFDFVKITDNIKNRIKAISHTETDNLIKYLNVLNTLLDKPIKLNLTPQFYAQLSSTKIVSNESYIDAFCIAISDFDTAFRNSPNFQRSLKSLPEDLLQQVSSKIENYISYGDFVQLLSTNSSAGSQVSLKYIVYELTGKSDSLNLIDINWALKNFENISNKIFNNEEDILKKFIERLNEHSDSFNTEIKEVSSEFFEFFKLENLKLVDLTIEKALKFYESLSKEEIYESFQSQNKEFEIFAALIKYNHLNKFTNAFYSAYDDFIKGIANGEKEIPDVNIWDSLINLLDKRKLRSTFTIVRDILFNQRGEITDDELYFLEKGLIKYGNLDKKPESATLKILIPLIESDGNFENVFLERLDECVQIINLSKEHKDSAISELQLKYDSRKFNDNTQMKRLVQIFELKENIESSDEEE